MTDYHSFSEDAQTNARYSLNEMGEVCRHWGWFFAMGVALLILGTLAIGSSVITTFATVIFLGGLLAVSGVIQAVQAFWARKWKGFFLYLLMGILSVVVGALMIFRPTESALSLTMLLATFFIVSGLFKISYSLLINVEHWGWLLFNGIITLLLGILILAQWPVSALWVIGLFVGIDMVLSGWSIAMTALVARKGACRGHRDHSEDEYNHVSQRPRKEIK